MGHLSFLTRAEIETLGPPTPEDVEETGVSESFLRDLALKIVARLPEPTSAAVAQKLHLPCALTEEIFYRLYRERLIEMRLQSTAGATHYSMLDQGWERLVRLESQNGYDGPAPVSLADYTHMVRMQAAPSHPSSIETVRAAFSDLVLPESLLQTLGCVINSHSSLFLSGLPGTGKTAVSERIHAAQTGSIWIPYAVETDGHIIRIFDSRCHYPFPRKDSVLEYDRRWVEIARPLVRVGGELTLDNTTLIWSEASKCYEAPFQLKANGGTLLIDDFGRQSISSQALLNRWIQPLERRVDYLTLNNGNKIEVPFEQLVIFSTNFDENEFVDEAFLRRLGYRARIEMPTPDAYLEIFKRAANASSIVLDEASLKHVVEKYAAENRAMKPCEPRDLLNRVNDLCRYENRPFRLTPELVDMAWRNYFGTAHHFEARSSEVGNGNGNGNGNGSSNRAVSA